jgi:hypothetical protein
MPTQTEGRKRRTAYLPDEVERKVVEYAEAHTPAYGVPSVNQAMIDLIEMGHKAWKDGDNGAK